VIASQAWNPANDRAAQQSVGRFGTFSTGGQNPQNNTQMAPFYRKAEMADPVTRDELLAHLSAVEARSEIRQVALEGKLDRVLDQVEYLTGKVGEVKAAAEAATAETKMTRWNIVILVVTLFATILALIALGRDILETAKTLFDMGAAAKKG